VGAVWVVVMRRSARAWGFGGGTWSTSLRVGWGEEEGEEYEDDQEFTWFSHWSSHDSKDTIILMTNPNG
jgi:hypothetical protein